MSFMYNVGIWAVVNSLGLAGLLLSYTASPLKCAPGSLLLVVYNDVVGHASSVSVYPTKLASSLIARGLFMPISCGTNCPPVWTLTVLVPSQQRRRRY